MELHELNTVARDALKRKLDGANMSVFEVDGFALLLIANFLREISDNSHEISEHLNLISSYLQGIEMNTRPKP
jgi:hypothetical protein